MCWTGMVARGGIAKAGYQCDARLFGLDVQIVALDRCLLSLCEPIMFHGMVVILYAAWISLGVGRTVYKHNKCSFRNQGITQYL